MGTVSSMTGYGNVKIQTELGELNVDVRSVNSRFLDFSFRCLEEFRPFEPQNSRISRLDRRQRQS